MREMWHCSFKARNPNIRRICKLNLHGYIFRILQHFATKFCISTNLKILYLICLDRVLVYNANCPLLSWPVSLFPFLQFPCPAVPLFCIIKTSETTYSQDTKRVRYRSGNFDFHSEDIRVIGVHLSG